MYRKVRQTQVGNTDSFKNISLLLKVFLTQSFFYNFETEKSKPIIITLSPVAALNMRMPKKNTFSDKIDRKYMKPTKPMKALPYVVSILKVSSDFFVLKTSENWKLDSRLFF